PLGNVIAVVLLGEKWRGVGPILVALAPMAMATALMSVPNEIFKAVNRPHLLPRTHALATVSSIAFMLALVTFGAQGVGWAGGAGTVLVGLYSLSKVPDSPGVGWRGLFGAVVPPLAASLLAAAALFAFDRLVFGGQPQADAATVGRLGIGLLVGL